jgi:hypothetical protein
MGARLAELRSKVVEYLNPDMTIARANKSGVVRLKAPTLDTTCSFETQEDKAKFGIECAARFLKWYMDNITEFHT